MVDPVTMFADGGPFMYLIMLAGGAHLIALVIQLVLAKQVDLTPLLWAGVACIILLGMLGSMMGFILAFHAVAKASPETKQTLLAMGMSVSMYTTAASLMVALPSTFFTGIVASVVRTVRMREKAVE